MSEEIKKLATQTLDPAIAGDNQPVVDTAKFNEPHTKANTIDATTVTPEYKSILNTLRVAPIGQLAAIAQKHGIEPPASEDWNDDAKIQELAQAEHAKGLEGAMWGSHLEQG